MKENKAHWGWWHDLTMKFVHGKGFILVYRSMDSISLQNSHAMEEVQLVSNNVQITQRQNQAGPEPQDGCGIFRRITYIFESMEQLVHPTSFHPMSRMCWYQ